MNLMLGIINVQTKKSHPKLGSIIGFSIIWNPSFVYVVFICGLLKT